MLSIAAPAAPAAFFTSRKLALILFLTITAAAPVAHGAFLTVPRTRDRRHRPTTTTNQQRHTIGRSFILSPPLHLSNSDGPSIIVFNLDDDDDDDRRKDDEEEEEDEEEDLPDDPYRQIASSEFGGKQEEDDDDDTNSSSLSRTGGDDGQQLATNMDWGGALGQLRQRVDDMEQGKSGDPSQALFRLMSAQSPNQAIGKFVSSAKPQVVQAMSGAVSSLLGGLSSPASGVETIVKATGDKIGSLCFQLQMTGYMFRNVEYVMALKDLMKLRGSATLQDYKDAFDRIDADNNGYIEATEVAQLFNDVYDGKTPAFEIETFLKFFDQNKDGRVSWGEFERGLGAAVASQQQAASVQSSLRLPQDDDEEDDDVVGSLGEPDVTGSVEIEQEDGKIVQMDAKEYIDSLRAEAQALKDAIYREKGGPSPPGLPDFLSSGPNNDKSPIDEFGGIASYVASLQGDVKALTEGISPEIVETMKLLVDFVLEGGDSGKGADKPKKEEMQMEIPGSALQQLALWQLILGYKLREEEAKGDFLRLLE